VRPAFSAVFCIQLTIAAIAIEIVIAMACQLQLTLKLNGPPNGFCPLLTEI